LLNSAKRIWNCPELEGKTEVTKFMVTDVAFDMTEQRKWFARVVKNEAYRYWVVYCQDIAVGLINLRRSTGFIATAPLVII